MRGGEKDGRGGRWEGKERVRGGRRGGEVSAHEAVWSRDFLTFRLHRKTGGTAASESS